MKSLANTNIQGQNEVGNQGGRQLCKRKNDSSETNKLKEGVEGNKFPSFNKCDQCNKRHPRECKKGTNLCYYCGEYGHFIP